MFVVTNHRSSILSCRAFWVPTGSNETKTEDKTKLFSAAVPLMTTRWTVQQTQVLSHMVVWRQNILTQSPAVESTCSYEHMKFCKVDRIFLFNFNSNMIHLINQESVCSLYLKPKQSATRFLEIFLKNLNLSST